MKRSLISAALACAIGVASASAAAQEKIQGTNVPTSAMSELVMYADIVAPDLRGRDFVLLHARIAPSLYIGCDGSSTFALYDQLKNEVEGFIDYIGENWLALGINYLIFSNPTLYQIYENLNLHREFLRDQMLFSCSTVRDMAADRRNKALARAKDECLESGDYSPEECDNASNLGGFIPAAIEKIDDQLKKLNTAANRLDMRDLFKVFSGEAGGNKPPGAQDDGSLVATDPQAERYSEIRTSMLANMKREPAAGGAEAEYVFEPPQKTVGKIVEENSARYADAIDNMTAVAMTADGSGLSPSADVRHTQGFKDLQGDPGFDPLSYATIVRLSEMRRKQPWAYEEAKGALAREMSMSAVRYALAQVRSIYRTMASGGSEKLLDEYGPEALVFIESEIERLESELSVYQARADNVERLNRLERTITLPR